MATHGNLIGNVHVEQSRSSRCLCRSPRTRSCCQYKHTFVHVCCIFASAYQLSYLARIARNPHMWQDTPEIISLREERTSCLTNTVIRKPHHTTCCQHGRLWQRLLGWPATTMCAFEKHGTGNRKMSEWGRRLSHPIACERSHENHTEQSHKSVTVAKTKNDSLPSERHYVNDCVNGTADQQLLNTRKLTNTSNAKFVCAISVPGRQTPPYTVWKRVDGVNVVKTC